VLLLEQGYNVVVVDNLVNSSEVSLDRVCEICQIADANERKERLVFRKVDLCDSIALRNVFEMSPTFEAAIHFAGLKVRLLLHGTWKSFLDRSFLLPDLSSHSWTILSINR
jgi:UDP-glucose 4-epimerase